MKIQIEENENLTVEINSKGFIKLDRKILDWEWYKRQNIKDVFIHCLLKANYIEKKYQGKTIPRGSFISSENTLANELGLSRQNVRTAIKHLISTKEITKKVTKVNNTECTLFTVQKYDLYQSTNQAFNQETNRQLTTTKNIKNKKENNICCETQPCKPRKPFQLLSGGKEVIDYLNMKANRHFTYERKENRYINDRLKSGATVDEFKKIIDLKCNEWLESEKMRKYLTPKTLFSKEHFESYLEEANEQQPEPVTEMKGYVREVE